MSLKNKINDIIIIFEKKLNLDLKFFLNGSFWLILCKFFLGFFSIFSTWILTTFLTKNEFGIFQFFLATIGLVSIFTLSGLNNSLIISVSKGFDRTYLYLTKRKFLYSILGTFALAFITIYFYFFKPDYWIYFFILLFFYPIRSIFSLQQAFYNGKNKYNYVFLNNFYSKVVGWGPLLIIATLTQNIFYVIITYILSTTIYSIFSYLKSLKLVSNNLTDKTSFEYGFKLSLLQLPNIVISHLDKIIIAYFLGLSELSNYVILILFADQIISSFSFFRPLLLPKMASQNFNKLYNSIRNKVPIIFLLNLVTCFFFIIISPYIINLFFPDYISIIPYLIIVILSLSFAYLQTVFSTLLVSHKKLKIMTYQGIFFPIFRAIITFILIYKFGFLGAVLAYSISNLFRTLFLCFVFYFFLKESEKKAGQNIPLR